MLLRPSWVRIAPFSQYPIPEHPRPIILPQRDSSNCARGADKFLARPGRKQATATKDFDVHISYL